MTSPLLGRFLVSFSLQSAICDMQSALQMSYTVIIVITETKSRWLYSPIFTSPEATNCYVRGTRTQPLICVGCSVYHWVSCAINKGGFSVVVDTHLPRFEAPAYVLPHFDALNHVVILVSSPFIFQRFAEVWYSVLNLRKAYIDLCLLNRPKWRSLLLNFTLD